MTVGNFRENSGKDLGNFYIFWLDLRFILTNKLLENVLSVKTLLQTYEFLGLASFSVIILPTLFDFVNSFWG